MSVIINKTGAGKVIDWDDTEGLSNFIDDCWERFQTNRLDIQSEEISGYSRRALTARMAELMDSLIEDEDIREAAENS